MASTPQITAGARPNWQRFLTAFMKAPKKVASPFASSQYLVDQLLNGIDWACVSAVVEYGPGTGIFTGAILNHLGGDGRLLAIESDAGLARHLDRQMPDPRLTVANGSALDAAEIAGRLGLRPDVIVTGLPFSSLDHAGQKTLIDTSARLLRDDGRLLAYQVRRSMEPYLLQAVRSVVHRREWRNVPPCHLYWCR